MSEQILKGSAPTCFLCLEDILTNGDVDVENSSSACDSSSCDHPQVKVETEKKNPSSGKASVLILCRYLQIDIKQLLANLSGTENVENLQQNESMSFCLVTLCRRCSNVFTLLSSMCRELELLQMKVDHYLESVWKVLKKSNEEASVSIFCPKKDNDQEFSKLLRKEMRRKCQVKLNGRVPKVKLTKDPSPPVSLDNTMFEAATLSTTDFCDVPRVIIPPSSDFLPRGDKLNEKISQKNIRKVKRITQLSTTKPLKSKFQTCTLCDPPESVPTPHILRHKIRYHLDTMFGSSREPHLTPNQFKEYCAYVLQVEMLSILPSSGNNGKLQDSRGYQVAKCLYCSFAASADDDMSRFRLHVCTEHQSIITQKLEELQKSTSVTELRASQLPKSCSWWERDPSFVPPTQCDVCSQFFATNSSMRRHKRLWHLNNVPEFTCDTCGKTFRHKYSLKVHNKVQHEKRAPEYKCEICGKAFQYHQGLRTHKKARHGLGGPGSTCEIPNKSLISGNRKRQKTNNSQQNSEGLGEVPTGNQSEVCEQVGHVQGLPFPVESTPINFVKSNSMSSGNSFYEDAVVVVADNENQVVKLERSDEENPSVIGGSDDERDNFVTAVNSSVIAIHVLK